MEITKEDFETLPESMKSNFVENGDVFVSAESQKLNELQTQFSTTQEKYAALEGQLSTLTQEQQAKIEEAKQTAYDKAVSENDTTKLLEIEQQKALDAQKRADQYKGEFDTLRQGLATEKAGAIIDGLLTNAVEGGELALKRLLAGYVKVDPETGVEQFLNDDGSVSSLNRESFVTEQLMKNPVFTSLTKGEVNVSNNGVLSGDKKTATNGAVPASLEECNGDRKKEAAFFNKQMGL